jgi:dTDP-4-amino-4,6-dideoxygalactose transaminase
MVHQKDVNSYSIVEQFERRVADFAGSKFAVSCESCTAALFLSMHMLKEYRYSQPSAVRVPLRTYASVPMAALQAGFNVELVDFDWTGAYALEPLPVVDGAKRFRRGMYQGGLHCLSFHAKKSIAIGRGGMILTDDAADAALLKRLRYDGRDAKPYSQEAISVLGWNMYMTPDQAARGLMLMDIMPSPDGFADQTEDYPPLTNHPVFKRNPRVVIPEDECKSQYQYA